MGVIASSRRDIALRAILFHSKRPPGLRVRSNGDHTRRARNDRAHFVDVHAGAGAVFAVDREKICSRLIAIALAAAYGSLEHALPFGQARRRRGREG